MAEAWAHSAVHKYNLSKLDRQTSVYSATDDIAVYEWINFHLRYNTAGVTYKTYSDIQNVITKLLTYFQA